MAYPDPRDLLALAIETAREATALLVARLHDVRAVGTKSSPTDMVSDVDRATEALITARILAARPKDAILGEEAGARPGTSGVRWLVDPLDGTTNYLYGYPAFAVSIAAEADGATIAGVVCDAARGEIFAAALGSGATRDSRAVAVSARDDLPRALIGTGFAYDASRRAHQAAVLARLLPRVRDVRRAGSAALDLCAVACGRLDAFYEAGLAPWDFAAGALIVREAGGLVDLPPAGALVAAGPRLFPALLRLVRESEALAG
ncbi:MAG: inositol monophosphatase [Dehalococcoidia bacterium]|nr:inositol monophosphatase [Dehalococcoidia bacterium]